MMSSSSHPNGACYGDGSNHEARASDTHKLNNDLRRLGKDSYADDCEIRNLRDYL
jgi:hypothetical protein